MTSLLVLSLLTQPINAPTEKQVDYLREIKPIFQARCYACHGALKQKAKLRLDTADLIRKGSRRHPVITPGNANKSELLERIRSKDEDLRMPPEGKPLTDEEITLIQQWINQGANGPVDEKPEQDPDAHWAFQKPERPPIPIVKNQAWMRNPIDAFIAAKHEQQNLKPLPDVEKSLLLRRAYLDLIGLPPTREQLQAFLKDDSEDAFEKVIDTLLSSPQHGERWGRHWMDVWRYTDWYGLGKQLRYSQKHIWHWRDWIIESLNEDKGYDQMVLQMLAADELYPTDQDALRATGFLARNYFLFNRTTWLDLTIEHTSKAFLGLTLQCAKCHDHKYDPITQVDFYRWRAIFEPHQVRLDQVPGELDLEKDGLPRVFDAHPEAPTYVHVRGNEKDPDKSVMIKPGIPDVLAFEELQIQNVQLPPEASNPALNKWVLENYLHDINKDVATAQAQLKNPKADHERAKKEIELAQFRRERLLAIYRAEMAKEQSPPPANLKDLQTKAVLADAKSREFSAELSVFLAEKRLKEANAKTKPNAIKALATARKNLANAKAALAKPGQKYERLQASLKALEGPAESSQSRTKPYPKISTGRRSALAKWLVDHRNPLTARVAVNHVWMRHFGQPLVESITDFGRRAPEPAHRELLDWLAVEFIESGWNFKHLHRLMVTSKTYRLGGSVVQADSSTREKDPDNQYYWRRLPLRMESQVIRDSLLSLAGELDTCLSGPTIDPKRAGTVRRSLYFTHSRDAVHVFLDEFDNANLRGCYRRMESIKPQQALTLANSKLSLEMARKLVDKLDRDYPKLSDEHFVDYGFELLLCAKPTAQEKEACLDALDQMQKLLQKRPDAKKRARQNLIHALLNHNDFVTIR